MKGITSKELQQLMDTKTGFQLIDVREQDEHDEFNIGGQLVPLAEITKFTEHIETGKPVVVYCRMGIRSQIAIQKLEDKFPFTNLFNLIGGIEAWKKTFAGV